MVDTPNLKKLFEFLRFELRAIIGTDFVRDSISAEEFSANFDQDATGGISIFDVVHTRPTTEPVDCDKI